MSEVELKKLVYGIQYENGSSQYSDEDRQHAERERIIELLENIEHLLKQLNPNNNREMSNE